MVPSRDSRSAEAEPVPENTQSSTTLKMSPSSASTSSENGVQGSPSRAVGGLAANNIGSDEGIEATTDTNNNAATDEESWVMEEAEATTDANNGSNDESLLVEEGAEATTGTSNNSADIDESLVAEEGVQPIDTNNGAIHESRAVEEGIQSTPPVDGRSNGSSHRREASLEKGMEATGDWAVNIESEKEELIQNPGKEVTSWSKLSIYKVPIHMCEATTDNAAYKPRVVSLGPYHYGTKPLSLMEAAKRRALIHLLRETNRSVTCYLDVLKDSQETIMEAYEQLDDMWREDAEKFLQMMVLDGCFVIEILRKNFAIYAVSDPVFSEFRQPTVIEYIRRDMLLLENQLPLIVIEKLAAIIAAATGSESDIFSLLLKFCFPDKRVMYKNGGMHVLDVARQGLLSNEAADAQGPTGNGQSGKCAIKLQLIWSGTKNSLKRWLEWLASLLRRTLMKNAKCKDIIESSAIELQKAWARLKQIARNSWYAPLQTMENDLESESSINNSRSVKELCEAGIDIQRSKSNRLIDITFADESLQIPAITVEHNAESMFLNFIAFEQLHLGKDRYVSSYFLFLGSLISSGEDVRWLRENEIIESSTAGDLDIEKMVKRLIRGLCMSKDDPFYQTRKQLNDHHRKSQKRCRRKAKNWWTNLCETHFASPWTIIQLFAAIAFLGLTVVSTVYTILQLYKGNNSR